MGAGNMSKSTRKQATQKKKEEDDEEGPARGGPNDRKVTKSPGGCAPIPTTPAAGGSIDGVEHHKPKKSGTMAKRRPPSRTRGTTAKNRRHSHDRS